MKTITETLNDEKLFSGVGGVRLNVSDYLFQKDVELGLKMLGEWGVRHFYPRMDKVADWAKKDPQHAANFILEHASDTSGVDALKHVGEAWAASNPQAALKFAEGLQIQAARKLAQGVIKEWAKTDLDAAVAWATTADNPYIKSEIGKALAEQWAKTDPGAALEWTNANLHGLARAEAVGELIESLARTDVNAAAELVAGMDPGGAANQAAGGLLKSWIRGDDPESHTAAFEWLASLPDRETATRAIESIQWTWMMNDPGAVMEFVAGPQGHLAPDSLLNNVAADKARANPEVALEWAAGLPEDRAGRARRCVIETWTWSQPEQARDWAIGQLAGEDRNLAIESIARNTGYREPNEAIEFLRTLPAGDRPAARRGIERSNITEETRTRLLSALR